jgi:signal transduction histidine kinase
LCNQLALIISSFVFVYFIVELFFLERRSDDFVRYNFYVHHIILSVLIFPVLWLNRSGKNQAASTTLIVVVSTVHFITGIIQAQPYRTEFYFLGFGAALFVLFSNQRVITILFLFIFLLFAISVYNINIHNPTIFSFDLGLVVRMIMAFSFIFMVLFLLMSEGNKNREIIQREARILEAERDEVLRANFTKDRVLSVISHDLRGPISSLNGLLTLISNNQLSQTEFQNHTQKLSKQVSQLQISLEELLNWSHSRDSALTPQPELLDVDQLVMSSVGGVKSLAEEKNISIQTNENHLKIYADQSMIRSVLTNLLTNAIKFTPVSGRISISSKAIETNMTCIRIHDTGIGIPKENLLQIFEGNFSTRGTNNEKGTGIGLLLSKDFISKNHGTIRVESEQNVGTTFILTLPLKATHPTS